MKNKNLIRLYKIGKFYNAYGDDGYVMHELLGYKFLEAKQSVGFPENALSKVENKLIEAKLNYEIWENNTIVKTYKGLNKNYNIILKKALSNLEIEKRINRLKEKINSFSNEELDQILEGIENGIFKS